MDHTATLTTGPIGKKIVKLMLPMMVGMISMVIFNLVDTLFIGRLGTEQLAAMSFTLPVVSLIGSFAMGLGLGASSIISRAIGSSNHDRVKRITSDSLILSVILVLIFAIIGLLTIKPLFTILGADTHMLAMIREYMIIWYLGVPFVVIPMVGNNAIRATGNTTIPSIIMLAAVFVNVVLDPILIFGLGPFPRMELAGAALATVIARASTLIVSLLFLKFKFDMISTVLPKFKTLLESWGKILYIGIPAAITQMIIPISIGVITRLVSGFGPESVAALGVSTRIEMFALSPLMALSSILVPFTGQNFGAGKIDRIQRGVKISYYISIIIGLMMFILFIFTGKYIGTIFNSDPLIVSAVHLYLIIVSASYGFQGIIMITASTFNALHKPINSAILNIIKMFGLYIPLAYIGADVFGLKGVFIGASLSSLIAGSIAVLWIKRSLKNLL